MDKKSLDRLRQLAGNAKAGEAPLDQSRLNMYQIKESLSKAGPVTVGESDEKARRRALDKAESEPKKKVSLKKAPWEKDEIDESEGRPYKAVHVKKGMTDVVANSSYEAAQKAAAKWKLKSTSGIDVHLTDVKKTATESKAQDRARYDADQGTGKKPTLKKAPWEKDEIDESDAKGEYYVEKDGDDWCVFHTDKGKGKAYGSYSSNAEAAKAAKEKNASLKESDEIEESKYPWLDHKDRPGNNKSEFSDEELAKQDREEKIKLKPGEGDPKKYKTEQEQMREWANSVYQQYEDKGNVQEQPEGETVDLSLRRYLNAKAMPVQIEEDINPKDMLKEYKSFKQVNELTAKQKAMKPAKRLKK